MAVRRLTNPETLSTDGSFPSRQPFDPPVVQCCLLRAASTLNRDGLDLILFSGPDESGPNGAGRSDLRLRYSTDETATWHDGPMIHMGPAAYSDMVRIGQAISEILFEAGEHGAGAAMTGSTSCRSRLRICTFLGGEQL